MHCKSVLPLFFMGLLAGVSAQEVRITEFVADNDDSLRFVQSGPDYHPPWIELYNAGPGAVNLRNWGLTSDPEDLRQWSFPAVVMAPDSFLVVCAAGPNGTRPVTNYLQTNFELKADGGFLALVQPDGSVAQSISFSRQIEDVAQGFGMSGNLVYTNQLIFLKPTLGRRNPSPSIWQRLKVTELMYHPAAATGSVYDEDAFEFIEFMNAGPFPLDLGGMRLARGLEFEFPNFVVNAGQRVLVVRNQAAFESRYGVGLPIVGEFTGGLSNEGQNGIQLLDESGTPVLQFRFEENWYPPASGAGFSLELADEERPISNYATPSAWRVSSRPGGSPGRPEAVQPLVFPRVLVNEVLSRSVAPFEDVVELFNSETNDADIGGWYLTDDLERPAKFRLPEGTSIPARGFLALDEHAFNGKKSGFSFESLGESIHLLSADLEGKLTGFHHGFLFGVAETNVTFGRHVISTGEEHFVPQSARTFAAENAGPQVGPLVISEIHYHPANGFGSFIELHNISGGPVLLNDSNSPGAFWTVMVDNVDPRITPNFIFPPGAVVPADGRALLVPFGAGDSQLARFFNLEFEVPPGAQFFGPMRFPLNRSCATVTLLRPGSPLGDVIPSLAADRVRYQDAAPWPAGADGFGASLQRVDDRAYGDDPANWRAAFPSPGLPNLEVPPPAIVEQPAGMEVDLGDSVELRAQALGAGPVGFQWALGGKPIRDATEPTMLLSSLQANQLGDYSCWVCNRGGAVQSSNAWVAQKPFAMREDTLRPVVLVDPPALFTEQVGYTRISGGAWDEAGLAGVFVRVGDDPFTSIPLTVERKSAGLIAQARWEYWMSNSIGTNRVQVLATDWSGKSSVTSAFEIVVLPTTRPDVEILTPAGPFSTGNSRIISISGAAHDNGMVTGVWVQRVGDPPVQAMGTTRWHTALRLHPGVNTILAWAQDWVGNLSSLVSVDFVVIEPETEKPRLSILPTDELVFAEQVQISGRAEDNVGVASVWVQQQGRAPVKAAGTSNWTATVRLSAGRNTLRLWAQDWFGNVSAVTTLTLHQYANHARLSLFVQGAGSVQGATNGQFLPLGSVRTLRAVPAVGGIFSNWLDRSGAVVSTGAVLRLRVTADLSLTANFVRRPFFDHAGHYNGLFYSTTNPAPGNAGFFSLLLTHGGAFSGRLSYQGRSHSMHGRFGADMTAHWALRRSGTQELMVTLRFHPETGQVTGSIQGPGFVGELAGSRTGFSNAATAAAFSGSYDTVLSAMVGPWSSTMRMTIERSGLVRFRGHLPDGAPVAKNVRAAVALDELLGEHLRAPLFAMAYQGRGSLFGWVKVTRLAAAAEDCAFLVTDPLVWARPPGIASGLGERLWLSGCRSRSRVRE